MAVPKAKTSKQRKHTRSANWKISAPSLVECKHCHEMKESHRACPNCGFYGGEAVIEIKEKKSK